MVFFAQGDIEEGDSPDPGSPISIRKANATRTMGADLSVLAGDKGCKGGGASGQDVVREKPTSNEARGFFLVLLLCVRRHPNATLREGESYGINI